MPLIVIIERLSINEKPQKYTAIDSAVNMLQHIIGSKEKYGDIDFGDAASTIYG